MPAKWVIIILCLAPVALFANQDNDMELFEFLAMYEENDNVFIDSEIDDRNENIVMNENENPINQKVIKSESDE